MSKERRELVTLTFEGPGFEDHGLEIDVLSDLIAYKKLLVETAKELWRRNNPTRERLPRGFEECICIKFYRLGHGSTAVPLVRPIKREGDQMLFPFADELIDQAADVIEGGIEAGQRDQPLPEGFPRDVIPLFEGFGKTLGENDRILIESRRRQRPVHYTPRVREQLMKWTDQRYEDNVDVTGEVRAADLDGCNFTIRLENGTKVAGKFDPKQERLITDALRDHESRRLRVTGVGEFVQRDGALLRILRVENVELQPVGEPDIDPSARPIWEVVGEIGAQVPDEEWRKVPTDLAKNLDHYLYGSPKAEG